MKDKIRITIAAVVALAVAAAAVIFTDWRNGSRAPSGDVWAGVAAPAEMPWILPESPTSLPPLRFANDAGQVVSADDFLGKIVVLNLWATWCAPCLREMPSLDRLQAALGGDDFAVVAISQDRGGLAEVEPFWRDAGLTHLTVYLDKEAAVARAIAARGMPTTVLIDRHGRERARLEGPAEWDSPHLVSYFKALIAATGSQTRGGPAPQPRYANTNALSNAS